MRGGVWKGAAPLVPRFACQDRRSAVLALNGHAACTYTATSWPCEDTEGTHETEGEGAREEAADAPRLALAYEVARRLVYLSGPEFPELPVVQAAKKLESLLALKQISESQHQQLLCLLNSLEGRDMDRCERIDDLADELTRSLTVWPEVFPDAELERLQGLL